MSSTAALTNNVPESRDGNDATMTADTDDGTNANDPNNHVITPQPNKSKKNKKNRAKIIATTKTSLDRRMTVEKNVLDELLLVGGVIGTTTSSGNGNELVPVTDCLNWLQDLQRALRRDEDLYRPISLKLGKWNIVEQKLLPLVVTCRYDTPIVLTVLKILVILTKPLSENTQRAGQMIIDTNSVKSDPAVVAQQIKLRENALAQAEQLMDYKRIVTFHSSHYQKNNSKNGKNGKGTGILSVFVSLLAEPLSRSGASRTDADHMTIELVLHLIRNLLSAQPLLNSTLHDPRKLAKLQPCNKIHEFRLTFVSSSSISHFHLSYTSIFGNFSSSCSTPPGYDHSLRKRACVRDLARHWTRDGTKRKRSVQSVNDGNFASDYQGPRSNRSRSFRPVDIVGGEFQSNRESIQKQPFREYQQ